MASTEKQKIEITYIVGNLREESNTQAVKTVSWPKEGF